MADGGDSIDPHEPEAQEDVVTLRRRNVALGNRLLALESEASMKLQTHAEELSETRCEVRGLREEVEARTREVERMRAEVARLQRNAETLESQLARAQASSGASSRAWRVLLLDATARASLAACRALGRAGHEVGAAGSTPTPLVATSRYIWQYHELPDHAASQEAFEQALRDLVGAHRYEVLVIVDDRTLARLGPMELPVPSFPALGPGFERVTDKTGLARLCDDVGVPYPSTLVPRDQREVEEAVEALGLPVVVKAARSAVAPAADRWRDTHAVHQHEGAVVANDTGAAAAAFTAYTREGLLPIVQQFIHRREKINLSIFRRGGRSEMRFTYRVLRDVPLTGGIAMAAETISPDSGGGAEAVAALERVCDAAGYDGLANGEFCRAPDGRLYLIEINPRLWGSTWFAERLGQRVVERGVRMALALPSLPEVPFTPGRRFHHPAGELRWLGLQRYRPRAMRELLRTTRPWDVFDGDELSDPRPIVKYVQSGLHQPH